VPLYSFENKANLDMSFTMFLLPCSIEFYPEKNCETWKISLSAKSKTKHRNFVEFGAVSGSVFSAAFSVFSRLDVNKKQ